MSNSNTAVKGNAVFDVEKIRKDFPILSQTVRGKPLIYLDNGATTHKPQRVIDRVGQFDAEEYGTVRRGAYKLCENATQLYEDARKKVADFMGAEKASEIVFTSGTTQAINLVAHSFGKRFINKDDEIIISNIEHHANTVPWQILCEERGAKLKVIPVNDAGELVMEEYEIPAHNFVMYRVIDGDKSDCIPGIKGWGKKTLMKKLPMILEDKKLSVQDLIDEGLDEDIIRLNYDLMQLDDVDISGNAKLKIQNLSDDADNRLVKFEFQKMVLEDRLNTAFPNLDVWLAESFNRLNIILENHINDR